MDEGETTTERGWGLAVWPYCVLISLSSIRYRREGFDFWLVRQGKSKGESRIIVSFSAVKGSMI